jgi:hypothetical protein
MVGAQVEYLGFVTNGRAREYTLRVRPAEPSGAFREFTLAIPTEAFLSRRVRYQDAPGICYLKLQRELAARAGEMPPGHLRVSDAELEEYRVAHAPRAPERRPKPASGA